MGWRRIGLVVLVLLLFLLLIPTWWSPSTDGPPAAPPGSTGDNQHPGPALAGIADPRGAGLPRDELAGIPAEGGPRRSGPPDLGPGLGSGLGLEEPKGKRWLTGRLVGADGKPLAGVSVRLEPELATRVVTKKNRKTGVVERVLELIPHFGHAVVGRCGRTMESNVLVATTDGDGRFSVPAPGGAGDYRVVFSPPREPREILHRTRRHRFTPGHQTRLGEVRLPAGGTLEGRVTDFEGRAVPGAAVSYWPEAWGRTREELLPPGEAPVDRVEIRARMMGGGGGGLGSVTTDAEGRFRIPSVPPGTHLVMAQAPGSRKVVTIEGIRVHDREEVSGLRLVVEGTRPPLIAGRVFDAETGKPIRASVRLRSGSGGWQMCRIRSDGRFIVGELSPDEYWIHVFAPGHEKKEFGPYRLSSGQRLEGLELKLDPKPE